MGATAYAVDFIHFLTSPGLSIGVFLPRATTALEPGPALLDYQGKTKKRARIAGPSKNHQLQCQAADLRRRASPAMPIRPTPSSASEPGSGTGISDRPNVV